MAEVLLWLFFVTTFLGFVAGQQTSCSVSVGASLTATPGVTPWLSSSGDFAFGFRQLQGNGNFLLSIWYDKIPDKTIIWYPETNATVSRGSKVELIDQSGLVLTDSQGREVWSTSGSFSDLACGFINDTGNFVILGNNSGKIWESFSYPADTLLPTQVMEMGGQINSKKNKTNFSRGRFQLRMQPDGNLVLYTRDIFTDSIHDAYYASGTFDTNNSTNSGERLIFDATGYMYILRRNGQTYDLTQRDTLPSGDYYHRATLDPDGLFTQYYYPKNPTGNASWEVIWSEPEDICFKGDIGSGACGLNNVCSLDGNRPKCECPRGFSLLDSNDPNGDCDHDLSPRCDEGYAGDLFDFIELNNTDWPGSDYAHIRQSNEQNCKLSCREDCFCAVAIFRDNQCWKKAIPLSHGKKTSQYVKAFLKYQKDERPPQCPPRILKEKDQRSLVLVGSVLLGTCVFVIVVLTGVICLGFFLVYKKKPRNPYASSKAAESNLPRFTYQELVEATNGFKDELGRGAFGIVYKGVIGTNIVAVKKLDRVVEDGEKEFKTEVNVIARTHHKNLVQLLGYCDDGEQRLLIYEYMRNGTLAAFLFKDMMMKPSWKERSYIGVGIAKGLAYLHEECSTQIIHCDIKPQNILLDDYYNAKISDFGLAKLLLMNQSRTNTGIRGTKGYVAPEWFRNTPVTVKVDVFSYGVLLLEIISCQKSVVFDSDKEDVEVLTDWAWDCYHEGRVDAFVEDDREGLDDLERVTTFVKVGLWCVQENPSLRPTMRKVVQMLEDFEVTDPPCPCPLFVLLRLIFLITFLGIVSGQRANCFVSVDALLTATPDVKPWLSSSGDFAFGFQQLQGNDNFLLSIWYDKIPDKTVIWYPEGGPTVHIGSKIKLTKGRGLVLTDPQGREVWSTSSSVSDIAGGFMNDTGNFVILGKNSRKIWESFSYPADTLLPTQVIEIRGEINSKKSKTNFSHGKFQLRLLPDGNLVLNTRDVFTTLPLDAYYISGTRDADNSAYSGYQLIFDATGCMYILRRNGERYDLTPRVALPTGGYYHRATLNSDGLFTQYYYPKNPTADASWAVIWYEPKEICFGGSIGSGACGINNVCSLDGNRPKCECPQGFSLLDSNDPNGDCNRDFSPRCDEGYEGDLFDFIELNNTDWPGSDYAHIRPSNEQSCKLSCREDCFCAVAIFRDDQCWKKALPLSHGKKTSSEYVKALLKYQKDKRPPRFLKEKDERSQVHVGSAVISTHVLLIAILTGVICLGFFLIYKKNARIPYPSSKAVETHIQL